MTFYNGHQAVRLAEIYSQTVWREGRKLCPATCRPADAPTSLQTSRQLAWWTALAGVLLVICVSPRAAAAEEIPGLRYSATPSESEPYAVCPKPTPGHPECLSIVVPPTAARAASPSAALAEQSVSPFGPALQGGGEGGGWAPAELRSAYRLPSTGGSEQTVAIVDAYNDPNAEADLKQYRSHYGLAECTKANGCFKKVNQAGETEPKEWPASNVGWSEEISLDLDMVSAICPGCHILLVEAANNETTNLYAAENEAAALKGTTAISNSWGLEESSEETTSWDKNFNHAGIPITASAGDNGYGVSYPAASKYVISVGGTTLYKTPFYERGWFEEAWIGTGGGCSAYEAKPSWQTDSGCARRTDNDVAAIASPESPVSVYDSYEKPGWMLFGGTSVAAPIVAAVEALASSAFRAEGAAAFYKNPESMFDITTGANWYLTPCSTEYLCNAGSGYDGPTGNGAPDLAGGGKGLPGTWSNVAIPGSANHSNAVSCVSASSCVAVGAVAGEHALAESWNGTQWSPLGSGVARPEGGSRVTLLGVSCTAANACTAVGNYWGTPSTLAERWNGSEWTVQSTPNPSGSTGNHLRAVSCAAATSCVAVGEYLSGGAYSTLAESWNGTKWSLMTMPTPTGATSSYLNGVSCTSATACVAVGQYVTSAGQFALAESWNGTEWTIQSTPKPAGTTEINLQAVSCTSATACTAVGHYYNSTIEEGEPLAIRWNGTEWSLQTVANPNKVRDRFLSNVSCVSASSCEAVGVYYGTAFSTAGTVMAEHWNGTEWSWQQPPSPGGSAGSLVGLSCTAATACVATGSYSLPAYFPYSSPTANLAYTLSGTTWSQQPMPVASASSAVACASSLACAAVGGAEGEAESPAEVWNGAVWSSDPPATPSGALGFGLAAIACVSTGECTSVGSYTNSAGTRVALAELLKQAKGAHGPTWSVQATPNPTGATRTALAGVACSAASACGGVGAYTNSAGVEVTLAERWNGSEWTVQSTPNPTGAKAGRLQGISCSAASACGAVGAYTNSAGVEVTLAESWNGSEWTIQSTPNPTGAKASSLRGIACTSATACVAVGRYVNSSGVEATLAESWNGSEWTIQTTLAPVGATASSLRGISCASAKACTAVGSYASGATVDTLTEANNGSEWFIESSPNPGGASESVLEGVSCVSTPLCMATGSTVVGGAPSANMANAIWGSVPAPTATTQPATSVGNTTATLNGTVNPNGAETTYHFEYGKTTAYGKSVPVPSTNIGFGTSALEESYTLTGLDRESTYHFRILATNGDGTTYGADHEFLTTGWALMTTPNPSGAVYSDLAGGVSCSSGSACTAVGFYEPEAGTYLTLTERWNGTEWKLQSAVNPSGTKNAGWVGVSCSSATACMAVGYYTNSSGVYFALAELWNGSEWKVESTPEPSGTLNTTFTKISCASSTECTAVGYYENASHVELGFAERWNGTSWSLQTTPNPTGGTGVDPYGVSCTASTSCMMIGSYKNGSVTVLPFAEQWNGTEWTLQSMPSVTGATENVLRGVSCTSSSACSAAGSYVLSSGTGEGLVERWNGTEWKIQSTPEPPGSKDSYLTGGVSCASATICTSAGVVVKESDGALAERWNGTEWKIQSMPSTEGETALEGGVSCASTTKCIAVGRIAGKTLAESY